MNKLEHILNKTLMPAAVAVVMYAMPSNAATVMTVDGPFVTTGDYISNGTGVLEQRWRYDITNTSTVGDANNMINWNIDVGTNNNVLDLDYIYNGSGSITLYLDDTNAGFNGILPPGPAWPDNNNNNSIQFYVFTPVDTPPMAGITTATARGIGYNVPFNSVEIQVPSNIPEPTSGLLLLIGAGALAYQRKR